MALKCDSCGGALISRGEVVCSKCGMVQGPEMESEPTFFNEGQKNPVTSYYPPNRTTGELGSVVGRGFPRGEYSEGKNYTMNKIRWGERIDYQNRNKNGDFYRAVATAQSLLGLPNHIREDVLYYHKAVRNLPFVGYSYDSIVAGYFLFVCRLRKHPIPAETIYALPYTNRKTIKKVCYALSGYFHTPLTTTPLDCLSQPITSSLPPATVSGARELLDGWMGDNRMRRVISGDNPSSWAAAALVVAGGGSISAEEAGGMFKISPSTIKAKIAKAKGGW